MEPPAVAILADDLIWSTRLADLVRRAGRPATVVRSVPALVRALATVSEVVVDLTSRTYDGVAAVEIASHGGHRVLCVAQHDDVPLRKRAIGAGADRVYAYRLLAERGVDTLAAWMARGDGDADDDASDDADEDTPRAAPDTGATHAHPRPHLPSRRPKGDA